LARKQEEEETREKQEEHRRMEEEVKEEQEAAAQDGKKQEAQEKKEQTAKVEAGQAWQLEMAADAVERANSIASAAKELAPATAVTAVVAPSATTSAASSSDEKTASEARLLPLVSASVTVGVTQTEADRRVVEQHPYFRKAPGALSAEDVLTRRGAVLASVAAEMSPSGDPLESRSEGSEHESEQKIFSGSSSSLWEVAGLRPGSAGGRAV